MHYLTFSKGTNDLTSAWTRTLTFWNTFETTGSRNVTKKIMLRKEGAVEFMSYDRPILALRVFIQHRISRKTTQQYVTVTRPSGWKTCSYTMYNTLQFVSILQGTFRLDLLDDQENSIYDFTNGFFTTTDTT